jgi:hypothetical protein
MSNPNRRCSVIIPPNPTHRELVLLGDRGIDPDPVRHVRLVERTRHACTLSQFGTVAARPASAVKGSSAVEALKSVKDESHGSTP